MPSNKEQIDGILARLVAVEAELGIRPKPEGWWVRKWEWTKTHKGTIISLTALILIIPGWFVSGWFKYHLDYKDDAFNDAVDGRITTKLSPVNTKLDGFDVRLAKIEGKLDVLLARASITDSAQYIKRGEFTFAVKAAEEAAPAMHEATISTVPTPPPFSN